MTGRVPLHEDERAPKSCIEFSVRGSLTEEATTAIQEQFMSFSNNGVDISFQLAWGARSSSCSGTRPVMRLIASMLSPCREITPATSAMWRAAS